MELLDGRELGPLAWFLRLLHANSCAAAADGFSVPVLKAVTEHRGLAREIEQLLERASHDDEAGDDDANTAFT